MAEKQRVTGCVVGNRVLCENAGGVKVVAGGEGPRATDLLLMSVAGCSGATLAAIMNRDGLNPDGIEMTVEGVRSESSPKRFKEIYVHYVIVCKGVFAEKMEHYLDLTEKICPVIQSLNSAMHMTYELRN